MATDQTTPTLTQPAASQGGGEGVLGITLGVIATGMFYTATYFFPHPWIQRYFLGHWVCVAATLMFGIAAGILLVKFLRVSAESKLGNDLRDAELAPDLASTSSTSDQWLQRHDAGRVARAWLQAIEDLPLAARRSRLVGRLSELLSRQMGRVSTRHLADDIREISARESDTAHDSLQLIRIIVWAIPMLGFLGTVVGITQTLGDLDFTNGDAAIENLKTGLYVAFDTTAIGLVLSVLAIFLQFPVERAEQNLLGEIDRRIGTLLVSKLPSDDAADNPAGQISLLCDGIRVAVAESLTSQTALWRQTIDEAHLHWQRIAVDNGQKIGDAIMQSLAPALREHSQVVAKQTEVAMEQTAAIRNQLSALADQSHAQQHQAEAIRVCSQSLIDAQDTSATEIDRRWSHWTSLLTDSTRILAEHQQVLIGQLDELTENRDRADQLLSLQSSLDSNLLRIAEATTAAKNSIESNAFNDISHAMMTLASAVDILAIRLPSTTDDSASQMKPHENSTRRAA